jgi:hypothetical protein
MLRLADTLRRAERCLKHEPSQPTLIKRMEKKSGKTVIAVTIDDDGRITGYTFAHGDTGKQAVCNTDAEWAAFEARHGKT